MYKTGCLTKKNMGTFAGGWVGGYTTGWKVCSCQTHVISESMIPLRKLQKRSTMSLEGDGKQSRSNASSSSYKYQTE